LGGVGVKCVGAEGKGQCWAITTRSDSPGSLVALKRNGATFGFGARQAVVKCASLKKKSRRRLQQE
jgi:hypothetical protein